MWPPLLLQKSHYSDDRREKDSQRSLGFNKCTKSCGDQKGRPIVLHNYEWYPELPFTFRGKKSIDCKGDVSWDFWKMRRRSQER